MGSTILRFRPDASSSYSGLFGRSRRTGGCGPRRLVARVDPMKDHDTFLDAAGLVAKMTTECAVSLSREGYSDPRAPASADQEV